MFRIFLLLLITFLSKSITAQNSDYEDNITIVKYCTDKIQEEPNNYFYYKGRADAEFFLKDYSHAISDYSMAIKLKPKDGNIFYNRGIVYYETKEFKLAKIDFNTAIKFLKTAPEAHVYLGLINQAGGDFQGAISNFTNAINDSSNYMEAYYNRGLCFSKINNYSKAIEDFKIVTSQKRNINAEINIAYNYAKLKQFTIAQSKIDSLILQDSVNAAVFRYKGLILIEMNDSLNACKWFFKAKDLGAHNIAEEIKEHCK